MGRQEYMTVLALGRSPYQRPQVTISSTAPETEIKDVPEPYHSPTASSNVNAAEPSVTYRQRYNYAGRPINPGSRELDRQSRRAQNDVLQLLGVCYKVDASSRRIIPFQMQSKDQTRLSEENIKGWQSENLIGTVISSADIFTVYAVRTCIAGFRHRLQALRSYAGISMCAIIKVEWGYLFSTETFGGGNLPILLHGLLENIPLLIRRPEIPFLRRLWDPFHGSFGFQLLLKALEVFSFIILPQLQVYGEVQRLGLLPASPVLPHWRSLIPFTASSPTQLPGSPDLTFGSIVSFITCVVVSPLLFNSLVRMARRPVEQKLYRYVRAALPKPQIPNLRYVKSARLSGISDAAILGLCNAIDSKEEDRESSSFLEELAKDLQIIGRTYQRFHDRWVLRGHNSNDASTVFSTENQTEEDARIGERLADVVDGANAEVANVPDEAYTEAAMASVAPQSPMLGEIIAPAGPDLNAAETASSNPTSNAPTQPSTPRNQVEVTASQSPSGTPHINVSFPMLRNEHRTEQNNDIDDAIHSSGASTPEISIYQLHNFHHTAILSVLPADILAKTLASYITGALFLPLEALYVRNLALSFLSSPAANTGAQAATSRWKGGVYPVWKWFGMGLRGGWRGIGDYVGKMILVLGMEIGLGLAVWKSYTSLALFLGKRRFGWGTL